MSDWKLLSVGSNSHGQLGSGTVDDAATFQPVLFCQSSNVNHQDVMNPVLQRTQNDGSRVFAKLALGANHTLLLDARSSARQLFVCGSNARGQLGPTTPNESCLHLGFKILPLQLLLCNLSDEDRDKVVTTKNEEQLAIVNIASALETSYIVVRDMTETGKSSDFVMSMGANDWDELGVGKLATPFLKPGTKQSPTVHLVQLGCLLESGEKAPPYLEIIDIHAGPRHVLLQTYCAEDKVTKTTGWGASRHGQLHLITEDTDIQRTVSIPRCLRSWKAGTGLVHVAAGREHSMILDLTRQPAKLCGFGSSKASQAVPKSVASSRRDMISTSSLKPHSDEAEEGANVDFVSVFCTWTGTYVLSSNGDGSSTYLHAVGSNNHGQLGISPSVCSISSEYRPILFPDTDSQKPESCPLQINKNIVAIACGSEHVLAQIDIQSTDNAPRRTEVWGWGWNEHGNLGLGGSEDVDEPALVWPSRISGSYSGSEVQQIWAGSATSWLLVQMPESS